MTIRPTQGSVPPAPASPRPSAPAPQAKASATGYSGESRFDAARALPKALEGLASGTAQLAGKIEQGFEGLAAKFSEGLSSLGDAGREAMAREALPPDQRAEYDQEMQALSGDPKAQKALGQALVDGKLTQVDPQDGKTALDHLAPLADPNAKAGVTGVDTKQVLAQTVEDIADPAGMDQGKDNALCGAASVMQQFAGQNPSDYARVVSDLTLKGSTTINHADGTSATLQMQPGFQVDPSRSSTEQIVGVALLNPSGGAAGFVTNNRGVSTFTAAHIKYIEENVLDGTQSSAQVAAMLDASKAGDPVGGQAWMQFALLGGNYQGEKILSGADHDASVSAAKGTLIDQTRQGQQVSVLLSPEGGSSTGHWVTVTAVDQASNSVTYVDGQGQTHTEDLDQFLAGGSGTGHAPVEALTFDQDKASVAVDPKFIDYRSDNGGGFLATGAAKPAQGGTTSTSTTK